VLTRYREKKIRSILKAMQELDSDSGIRMRTKLKMGDHEKFVFITRSGHRFVINIADPVLDESSGRMVPGGREEWFHFDTCEQAWKALNDLVYLPREAWLY